MAEDFKKSGSDAFGDGECNPFMEEIRKLKKFGL